jgi:PST family polysaccharide transporter
MRRAVSRLWSRAAGGPHRVRILRNAGWLTAQRGTRLVLGLLVGAWMARYLGPAAFGILSFAQALVLILGAVAGLGLREVSIRELVRDSERQATILGSSAALQLAGGALAYALLAAVVPLLRPEDALARSVILVAGIALLFQASEVSSYLFDATVRARYAVMARVVTMLLLAAVRVMLILLEAPLVAFAWAAAAEAAVLALSLGVAMQWRGLPLHRLRASSEQMLQHLRDGWPLLLTAVAVVLSLRLDQLMLEALAGDVAVGQYSAAVRIAEPCLFLGGALLRSALPRLLSLEGPAFEARYVEILRYPFYGLLALAVLIAAASGPLVALLFGAAYTPAAAALMVLAFSIPLSFLNVASSRYLLKHHEQGEILRRQLLGLVTNVGLNLVLIPDHGTLGAAAATLAAHLVMVVLPDLRPRYWPLLRLKVRALTGVGGRRS